MIRLLLIEDDTTLGSLLVKRLEQVWYRVVWCRDGAEGFERAREGGYAAILLDLMLPGLDGWSICRGLRDRRDPTPILMVSEMNSVYERVRGLELGADDYLGKPFAFEELKARIAALIRRDRTQRRRCLRIADMEIDTEERIVTRDGQPIALTPREYELLAALAGREGITLTRDTILTLWGEADLMPNTVDAHIAALRRKIDRGYPPNNRLIHTVYRRGYVLQAPARPS